MIERELTLEAKTDNLPELMSFLEAQLEENGCPPKTQVQISVAAEEIFVNIADYAYAPGSGDATVRVALTEKPAAVTVTFMDHGKPFDPTVKADPDVTLSAEERKIGGLGIFMTKKLMDQVRYEYRDGQNVLILIKEL